MLSDTNFCMVGPVASGRIDHAGAAETLGLLLLHGDAYEHLLALLPSSAKSWLQTTDVGLVCLDPARQPLAARPHARASQPLQHRPGGLVRTDLQRPLQTQRRDPVLLGGEQPAGVEPHRQRRARAIEDGPGRDRGPRVAGPAAPSAVAHPPPGRVTAARTQEAVRPSQPPQVVQAVLVGAEPGQELRSRSRVVRARLRLRLLWGRHGTNRTSVKWRSQLRHEALRYISDLVGRNSEGGFWV